MKRKLLTPLFAGILVLSLFFLGTSCSDSDDFVETNWKIEPFTVTASEWTWNPTERRWESTKSLNIIDQFIYEEGALVGYVFIGQQGVNEVQVQLPYIKNYVDNEGNTFEETIGYEFNYLTKRITFFIQDSQSVQDDDAKLTYNFRIVLLW